MFLEAIFAPVKTAFTFTSNKIGYIILKICCIIVFSVPYLALVIADLLVSFVCVFLRYIPIIGIIVSIVCWIFDLFPLLFFHLLILPDLICNKKEIKNLLAQLKHREELDALTDQFIYGNLSAEEYLARKNWILRP